MGPLDAQHLEPGDQLADFLVAAEIQGRILLIEAEQAGIGGAIGVQGEAPLIVQGQFTELAGEGLQAGLAVLAQVELLQVGRDRRQVFAAGRGCVAVGAKQLKNGFTEGAGLDEFGKAPLGGHPIGALDDKQGLGGFNLAVEGAFPIGAGWQADMLVKIQKGRLISLLQQPIGDPAGGGPVTAGVGDEDASHRARADRIK